MKIMRIIAPVTVLGITAGLSFLLAATKPEPEKETAEARPVSVYTNSASQSDTVLAVTAQGEVKARTQVELVAQVGGRIVDVSSEFIEGGNVQSDTTLVRIDDTDYRLALSRAKAEVASAEVAVQQAIATADVARKQLRNIKSPSALALKKPQVAQARARLAAAKAEVELAELNLSRTRLSLPFNGKLIQTRANVGQYVSPGSALASAFATDIVDIRLALSDSQLAALGLPIGYQAPPQQGPNVTLSATVAGKRQQWQGRLVRVDAAIDPSSRMLFATAQVDSPYDKNVSQLGMPLAVGLYVNASIEGKPVANAVTIPAAALRAGNQVYVVVDNKLSIRKVAVIHTSPTKAVLESGVSAGEQVVVSPVRNPVSGMQVVALSKNNISSH